VSRRIEPLASTRRVIVQHERGRVCVALDCDTQLSIYNGTDLCSLHEGSPGQSFTVSPLRSIFAARPVGTR
jgi:hypothetical protein